MVLNCAWSMAVCNCERGRGCKFSNSVNQIRFCSARSSCQKPNLHNNTKAVKVTTEGQKEILIRFNTTTTTYREKRMTLAIKVIAVILLLLIIFNLFRALFSMLKQDPNRPPMSYFIGLRLKFTAALLLLLILCLAFGVITPNARPY